MQTFHPLLRATRSLGARGEVPLVLIRHGQTASNIGARFVGRTDEPINDAGQAQAAKLGARLSELPRAALYASPLQRARQTAAHLGEPDALVPDLMELDQGELEGQLVVEARRRYTDFFAEWAVDPTHCRVPGGETMGECQSRALKAVEDIARAHGTEQPVLVVSHKLVLCSLVLAATGLPLRSVRRIPMLNTAISLFGWREDTGLRVYRFNDARHLRG